MKKKVILSVVILLIVISFAVVIVGPKQNTIDEALNLSPDLSYEILHIEEISNRVVVLTKMEDMIQFTILKKGIFSYKYLYSGVQGEYQRVVDEHKVVVFELPKVYMKNRLYCVGLVSDAAITKLEFTDQISLIETQTTNLDKMQYWSADLSEIDNREIVINAYNDENEIFAVEQILYQN
ncbi:MAG: hypothetical protein BGO41_15215 [Clostridiales bacterium 38-18]|nr:MAG: hypothetical protein BGO41_15215 [Clostridiales bacterium 38-18]